MVTISKAINLLRKKGPLQVAKKGIPHVYNQYLAPLLPRTEAVYNEIKVRDARLFDSVLPWRNKDKPYWEYTTIRRIENNVNKGDVVVVVGGGLGITAVKSAQKTGISGQVIVYEGVSTHINHIKDTISRNDVSDRVNVIHGIVGPKIHLDGIEGEATHVSPEELPECDVLELDCEGSEIETLKKLAIRPRVIIVESHGMFDAPSSRIEELLEGMSYSIVSKEPAEKVSKDFCVENDIYSLLAVRE